MFDRGYLTIARFRGVPIRVHWSVPIGLFVFSRFKIRPVFWLAIIFLIVVHEQGHAFLVRRRGAIPKDVRLHAFGGECHYRAGSRKLRAYDQATIAWGGVLAQAIILPFAFGYSFFGPPVTSRYASEVLHALTYANLYMIAFNLIPMAPLDGHLAWKWFDLRRQKTRKKKARQRRRELQSMDVEAEARAIVDDALDDARPRSSRAPKPSWRQRRRAKKAAEAEAADVRTAEERADEIEQGAAAHIDPESIEARAAALIESAWKGQ